MRGTRNQAKHARVPPSAERRGSSSNRSAVTVAHDLKVMFDGKDRETLGGPVRDKTFALGERPDIGSIECRSGNNEELRNEVEAPFGFLGVAKNIEAACENQHGDGAVQGTLRELALEKGGAQSCERIR
jgi:hypothetical protein